MHRVVAGLAALLLLGGAAMGIGGAAGAGETALPDPENPRNARFTPPWIGYLAVGSIQGEVGESRSPRITVSGEKENAWRAVRGGPDPGPKQRPLLGTPTYLGDEVSWTLDGRPLEILRETKRLELSNGAAAEVLMSSFVRAPVPPERHHLEARILGDMCRVETDAIRVWVWVEKDTLVAGDARFGSFVRRLRKSFDDLDDLLSASVHPTTPRGILDRFRIQQVVEFDRRGKSPMDFVPRDKFDIVVVCDQHGKSPGVDVGSSRIEFSFDGTSPHRGMWSAWGEQSLWRDLLHLRGVQALDRSRAAPGALPGRWKGELPLPSRYAVDLMASPFQAPVITEYTAVMANARYGVAKIGDCEDTGNEKLGHVWNWLPGRVALYVTRAGAAANGAVVRWWRSLPLKGLPADAPEGIVEGRAPDGEATADAAGLVGITGDYLGRTQPKESRSRWLLVEVEIAGKRRFEILYGLDLHLAYARGEKDRATVRWEFDRLLEPGGSLPVDR